MGDISIRCINLEVNKAMYKSSVLNLIHIGASNDLELGIGII